MRRLKGRRARLRAFAAGRRLLARRVIRHSARRLTAARLILLLARLALASGGSVRNPLRLAFAGLRCAGRPRRLLLRGGGLPA